MITPMSGAMLAPGRPRSGGRGRRALLLAGAVLAGAALGVGIDILRVGGLDAWSSARGPHSVRPIPPYEARGRLVEVGGRGVYLDCRGSGSPTVVLEAGFHDGAGAWGETLDGIAAFTRTCAWDRPGLQRSEPRGRHSAADAAADLRAALSTAGETGPYIVVAHSFGAVYARVFGEGPGATGDVVSYLLLDPYDPDLGMVDDPAIPAAIREVIGTNLAETATVLAAGEDLDWPAVMRDLAVAGPADLPSIRLSVDPRGRWVDPDPAVVDLLIDAWRHAAERTYPNARHEVVEDSGHVIQHDRPDLVIALARELVERARAAPSSPPPS